MQLYEDALNVVIPRSDAGDGITVKDYLYQLLNTLWEEGEGFSGKRPFGNSCWEYDLLRPLVVAGFISGTVTPSKYEDDWDDIEILNKKEAFSFVSQLIKYCFYKDC